MKVEEQMQKNTELVMAAFAKHKDEIAAFILKELESMAHRKALISMCKYFEEKPEDFKISISRLNISVGLTDMGRDKELVPKLRHIG